MENTAVLERKDSLDTIPDVDFIAKTIDNEVFGDSEVSEFRHKEIRGELLPEPLLLSDKSRFVLFPIKYSDVS